MCKKKVISSTKDKIQRALITKNKNKRSKYAQDKKRILALTVPKYLWQNGFGETKTRSNAVLHMNRT